MKPVVTITGGGTFAMPTPLWPHGLRTREPQYDVCLDVERVTLGPMASYNWRHNPIRLLFSHARYAEVAKWLAGKRRVAEIGPGDAAFSDIVAQTVGSLTLFDFDPIWAKVTGKPIQYHDITEAHLPGTVYDGVFMLDMIEHISPEAEPRTMENICNSLDLNGVFIAGAPTLESQTYASEISKAGHVNCKSGNQFREDAQRYFENVFLFGMNDATLHTGHPAMSHYHFILCTHPR